MLGLYDSGLGGLTVLRALRAAGVDQDVVYFADQAHVPYGDRSDADLHALLTENFVVLATFGIDATVMACNTSCAVAARSGGFPPARGPVLDLIANAAAALRGAPLRRIAVIATAATVRSGAYRRALHAVVPGARVDEIAAPALVPLVESGRSESVDARSAVAAVLAGLAPDIDGVLYGCTHYPLLDAHFAALLGPRIRRIDPAVAQAAAAAELVSALRLAPGTSRTHYLTNGDVAAFARDVRALTGDASATFGSAAALAS